MPRDPVIEPEVLPPGDSRRRFGAYPPPGPGTNIPRNDLESHPDPVVDTLVYYTDRMFSIGGFRFGLDGVVGLVPGLGDAMGGIISTVIIFRAAQAGVPKVALVRMVANVAIDVAVGAIPFVGDLFDFAFKANTINARIYRDALMGQHKASKDWTFLAILAVVLMFLIAIPIAVLAWAIQFAQNLF
jgi:hypothetical protein